MRNQILTNDTQRLYFLKFLKLLDVKFSKILFINASKKQLLCNIFIYLILNRQGDFLYLYITYY